MKDGGSAFPIATSEWRDVVHGGMEGMSLRDWFAGQALSGWLASFGANQRVKKVDELVLFVYEVADAMIAERDKEEQCGHESARGENA